MSHRRQYALDATQRAIEPFCDCEFPQSVLLATYKGHIPDLVKCNCGERTEKKQKTSSTSINNSVEELEVPMCEPNGLQWSWEQNETSDTLIVGADITFHPTYSQGTAIVRSERPLKAGMVHFWEIRIITPLAGTDVMFGIGTEKVELNQFQFHFVSALGTNVQSWGLSYNGKIQHNGVQLPYGQKFSQGCIVGACLDRALGTLEFYLNRRSLGVAYTNIPLDPQVNLYAMVCSTAARSVVRLINSTSQVDCLQLRAFKALSKQPKDLQFLREMPGFRGILRDYWFFTPPVRYSRRSAATELDIADEAVLSKSRLARKQKYKDDDLDINDLYSNAHKIAMRCNPEDEDDLHASDCFDEYFHYLF
ncbi:SPRY domain-containing SOCS box protein 3 isoform X1 [Rhagoletis pomonella]|uniref:SPRY domain-containing SOCS box protein 3 isoform X1 n=1 Tax=Rhagoletis pomonella TaxID=28610 RepID=UPI001780E9FC|nr:SPRY domain-containing SOCS box protein 3 isoform X1 [Rhagoletis pomonella]